MNVQSVSFARKCKCELERDPELDADVVGGKDCGISVLMYDGKSRCSIVGVVCGECHCAMLILLLRSESER